VQLFEWNFKNMRRNEFKKVKNDSIQSEITQTQITMKHVFCCVTC
jgi:hypothetical protein